MEISWLGKREKRMEEMKFEERKIFDKAPVILSGAYGAEEYRPARFD